MAPYLCLMNYNLHKLKIVEACHDYLHTGSAARKAEIAMKHREENNALYDIPDPETYRAAVASVLSGSTASFYQPSEEVRSRFEKIIGSHLKEILSVIPEKDSYTTDEVCSMMNLALAKVPNAVSLGWKAVVNKTAAYASVDLIDRKVIVPGSRSCGAYTWQSVRTTVAHEIGTHVFRAAGLGDCPCTALQKGLPGYDSFEEGLASIVEQSVSQNYTHPGIRHYISVGLAFIDGLNFRDTYNRLLEIYGRNRLSESLAFDSVQRAFRGTGELVYTKDLAYFNGYDRVWKFIEEHIDDESLTDLLFRSGKTDPTNEAHMNILEHCSREAVRSGTVA